MRITKPKRGRKAAKRIDLTDLKSALEDGRQWAAIGVIVAPSDGSPHWRIETNDQGDQVDILVEVQLQPSQEPITARLAAGMWLVPDIGEEVAVIVPAGRTDFMPVLVCILSGNSVPGGGQGPNPTTIVLQRATVIITDGTGGAGQLCTKADHDALRDYIANDLTLPVIGGGGGTAGPTASPLPPTSTGTQVLQAK